MLEWQIVWFDEKPPAALSDLCPAFQKRAGRYTDRTARQQSIEAYTVLEQLLEARHIPVTDIVELASGKWQIGSLYVSLSHTTSGAGALISTRNAAIDMETIRPVKKRLLQRVLNEAEYEQCRSPEDFMRMWTVKEAWIKLQKDGSAGYKQIDTTNLNADTFISHNTAVAILEETV